MAGSENPIDNCEKRDVFPDITIADVMATKGYEDLSDEEAENIVNSIKEFCLITYDYYKNLNQQDHEA